MESCCRLMSPLPFPVFSAPTCKGGVDGSVPFLPCWLKFTSHLDSHHRPGCHPPLHPSPGAMWEPSFLQHLRNKSDSLLTAAYSEAGGWGIRWNKWHSWQVFSRLVKKKKGSERQRETEGGKWGREEAVVFEEEKEFSFLNTLGLNEKFPHVLSIWKVSVSAADKRQPGPRK